MSVHTRPLLRRARWLLPVVVIAALLTALLPLISAPASQAAPDRQGGANLTWTNVLNQPGVFWYTVFFPSSQVGYASGGPDWGVTENGPITVAKTTNGGANWTTSVVTFGGTSRLMPGLACQNNDTCMLAGGSLPRILRTTNGGTSWTPIHSPYGGYLWSAAFTGQGDTALAGTTGHIQVPPPDPPQPDREGSWVRAANGVNFSLIRSPDQATIVQWDIECPAPGICYSASVGRAYYSNNDGVSWAVRSVPSAISTRFYGLSCVNETTCWMSGNRQRILYTTDRGVTWQAANVQPALGGFPLFWDIQMLDGQRGYAVGCTNTGAENRTGCVGEGMIYRTDNGVDWYRIPNPAPTTANLKDLHVNSMDDIVVVEWAGKIWRGTGAPPPTPTPTNTPTATATPTSTPTATPTSTPSPTPTPSTATIQGIAFADSNGNDLPDPGEPDLPGAVIGLINATTTISKTTAADGSFVFDGVAPGIYTVRGLQAPAGYGVSTGVMTFQVGANTTWQVFMPHPVGEPTPTPQSCYCSFVPKVEASFLQR
jgi:photosystem II stability/assembly factor-like uncharacterized protein